MELREFYESMGVDYQRVLDRLRKEERIEKYLRLMVKDDNYMKLGQAVEDHDYEEAFKAAHALKGISLNLDLQPLARALEELVEYLRFRKADMDGPGVVKTKELFEVIQKEYNTIIDAIGE